MPAIVLLAIPAAGQQVRSHALGFVLDQAGAAVRPIWGVPGAAVVGEPIDLGGSISLATASPMQDYVLALAGDARQAVLWTRDSAQVQVLAGVRPGATKIVVSPEGRSAAFLYADTNTAHVVTGLPSGPSASFDAALNGAPGAVAVADDGALLLVAADGDVTVYRAAGTSARIATNGPASAIAFLSNAHDALIAAANEALLVRDVNGAAKRTALPAGANGADSVAASADASRAVFVNAGSGSVTVVALAGGADPVTLNCAADSAQRTALPTVFKLNNNPNAPMNLLDLAASGPRLLVVPPASNLGNQ